VYEQQLILFLLNDKLVLTFTLLVATGPNEYLNIMRESIAAGRAVRAANTILDSKQSTCE
jgi:hypothetical protein